MGRSRHKDLLEELERLADAAARVSGVEVVEVTVSGSSTRRKVRIDIDRVGPAGVDLGDCKRVSDALGEALEDSDLIPTGYLLEVSSPGLDRPIVSPDDFRRCVGRVVVVEATEEVSGRRSFRGELVGLEEGRVRIREEGDAEVEVPLDKIQRARQDIGF